MIRMAAAGFQAAYWLSLRPHSGNEPPGQVLLSVKHAREEGREALPSRSRAPSPRRAPAIE